MGRRLIVWTLKDIRACIEKMTSPEVKFDCNIFIEGNRGLGKSTLGYKILYGLKIEVPFSPRRDLVYSRDDTLRHLASKINGCIMSDEMINVAYKRDFYQEQQKDLLKGFDMYRDSRNVFVGCIPKFIDLDVKIQKVCKLRLSVIRRGVALVQMQLPSIYSNDPWDVRNNQKTESKWALKGTRNPRYSQLTTCKGILYFGDLTPKQREEYDAIKTEKRNHVFAKYQDESMNMDPDQMFMNNTLKEMKAGNINPEAFDLLCKIGGRNNHTIRRKINDKLKEEGNKNRWKDYCLSDKARSKRDKMGFEMPEETPKEEIPEQEAISKEDKVQEAQEKPIRTHAHTHNEEQQLESNEPPNPQDVFGFNA